MRCATLCLISVPLFLLAGCPGGDSQENYVVSGRVTAAADGTPLGNIQVQMESTAYDAMGEDVTAQAGTGNGVGTYRIEYVRNATDTHTNHYSVTVKFTDTDGTANGGKFSPKVVSLEMNDDEPVTLDVKLDLQ